jgi:hypothetical protein
MSFLIIGMFDLITIGAFDFRGNLIKWPLIIPKIRYGYSVRFPTSLLLRRFRTSAKQSPNQNYK